MQGRFKNKVAIYGEIGSYSWEAALKFFGKRILILSSKNLSEVFEMVERKKADFGVIPIENSLRGSIGEAYDLLLNSKLKIFGEEYLRISHCLISHSNSKLKEIKKVFSHPQALWQCSKFLKKHNFETIPTEDTAGSVKMIKEKNLKDCAAIASKKAAKIFGMKILKEKIEDNTKNFTRFFILGKKEREITGKDKTSIVFTTKHIPVALWRCLGIFALLGINLTKLESRPIIGRPWEYNFYLDFEGHYKENKVKKAVEVLKENCLFLKILGSYPIAKFK